MDKHPTKPLREFYMKQNTVFLPEIEMGTAGHVIDDLAQIALINPKHIDMVICSPGGITKGGFAVAEFIEFELGTPVHARVLSKCHSAATYPLLACKKRIANEMASFVLHRQTSSITLEYSSNFNADVDGWKVENITTHNKQLQFYSKKLGLSVKEVKKYLDSGSSRTNNELTADQALKLGLLTEVRKLS